MVNFIHLYSRGFQHLKSRLSSSDNVRRIITESFAPGPYRDDDSVLLDWGSHDVSMCVDLVQEAPSGVEVKDRYKSAKKSPGEIYTVALSFPSGVTASCTFGNGADYKRRYLGVVYERGCLVYDGFSDGLSIQFSEDSERDGQRCFIVQPSPLECSLREFSRCILLGERSHPSISMAFTVHTALEAINRS